MSNRLEITGNLGRDPTIKTVKTKDGDKAVAEFSVFADNWKRDDTGKYEPDGGFWVSVSVWGVTADRAFAHLRKGARVTCAGRFTPHSYESKEHNETRYELRLTADDVMLELSRIEAVTFKEKQGIAADAVAERKAA